MLRQIELHGAASINEQVSAEVAMRAIDLHFAEGLLFISVLHDGYACSMMRTDDDKGLTLGIALHAKRLITADDNTNMKLRSHTP